MTHLDRALQEAEEAIKDFRTKTKSAAGTTALTNGYVGGMFCIGCVCVCVCV